VAFKIKSEIGYLESGGLEQLDAAEKISFWQQFETFRNRLPLIDHTLIAEAEASSLAAEYNFNNLTRFLARMFQLSHSEAAARVQAATAVGPRTSMLGERLQPLLPTLAAVQRDGAISTEKVQIVERAMRKLSRKTATRPPLPGLKAAPRRRVAHPRPTRVNSGHPAECDLGPS
jgi:hypothetical protein